MNGQIVISGTFVFPMMIAPASRRRLTTSASRTFSGPYAEVPHAVTSPATSTSSLMAMGTPRSGSRSPASRRRWASAASVRAPSAQHHPVRIELTVEASDAIEVQRHQLGRRDLPCGQHADLFRRTGKGRFARCALLANLAEVLTHYAAQRRWPTTAPTR